MGKLIQIKPGLLLDADRIAMLEEVGGEEEGPVLRISTDFFDPEDPSLPVMVEWRDGDGPWPSTNVLLLAIAETKGYAGPKQDDE